MNAIINFILAVVMLHISLLFVKILMTIGKIIDKKLTQRYFLQIIAICLSLCLIYLGFFNIFGITLIAYIESLKKIVPDGSSSIVFVFAACIVLINGILFFVLHRFCKTKNVTVLKILYDFNFPST